MGTRGREIVGEHLDRVLELLNKAFADEWLAYYQYWLGAKVVEGPMKDAVITELMQHAADELRHADMVSNRIIQLGGTPLTTPKKWFEWTNCGYDAPDDPFVQKILEQNISGEQCAISTYNSIIEEIGMKDPVTYNIAVQILEDEVEHEEDLQSLLEDLGVIMKK
ncbi:ferritin-like domain-containing protein [Prosthecochloris sp. N3]|uniref:Ferritin-like domain-containing protein n=1 Tax=Prosthecochloris ethylica TaxID=2743976 RepID=A0ABR9XTB7_9CHLB|nr:MULTISPECIES: ferritin-like domain-containing protein [Prosthecochloris]MBF0587068.1 ferritin-like domain-containing protein [Prosthecochloris ethylica]MBF0637234.1 ferritin-like domain-containing protein [Prosthecochloris ethylica]NUK48221.1 ferritin-like domain-containing protein [Prosthecochloris ethylica]RNA65627.1 ferritin [Prosthecochloris sp. ZM_2]